MQEGHMLFQMHEELSNLLFRGRSREKTTLCTWNNEEPPGAMPEV